MDALQVLGVAHPLAEIASQTQKLPAIAGSFS